MKNGTFRQGVAALSIGLGAFTTSLTLAYTSPALPSMINDPDFEITEEEGSWVGSVVPAFALLGSLLSAPLIESLGRKGLTLLFFPIAILGWVGLAVSPTVLWVVIARSVTGICLGVHMVSTSVYISEVIHVSLRDYVSFFPAILGTTGILVTNAVGNYLDWRNVAWLSAAFYLPNALMMIYLPETPFYHLQRGKKTQALEILTWYRDSPADAKKELTDMISANKESKQDTIALKDIFTKPNTWPVSMALFLHMIQQLVGINVIVFYSSSIFDASGVAINPGTCSVILSVVNVLANIFSSFLVGIYPRKFLIRVSSFLVIISLSVLSVYMYFVNIIDSGVLNLTPLFCIMVFVSGFSLGWGPVPFLFMGEGLPSKVKGPGAAVAISTNWASAFVITKTFPTLVASVGYSGVFLGYAVSAFVGMGIVEKYLPETFKIPSSEMDKFYFNNYKLKSA